MQHHSDKGNDKGPVAWDYVAGGRNSVLSMLSGNETRSQSRLTAADSNNPSTEDGADDGGRKQRSRLACSAKSLLATLVGQTMEIAVCQGTEMALTPSSSRPNTQASGDREEELAALPYLQPARQAGYRSCLQPGLE